MKNEIIQQSLEQLKKYCSECKLDTTIGYSNQTFPSFTIKINNNYSKKLVLSLAQNIINITEESFYAISTCRKNSTILFSFSGIKGKELTFFNNLLNFVKIIRLNSLYSCNINELEELIPAKMVQVANNGVITYIISEKIIQINNEFFDLKNGINKLNYLQKLQNDYAKFDLQEFCRSAKVSSNLLESIDKAFSN